MTDESTDTAPGNKRRKLGVTPCVVLTLCLYLLSFPPLVITAIWFVERGWISQHVRAATVILYYPIVLILVAFGFVDEVEAVFRRVVDSLP